MEGAKRAPGPVSHPTDTFAIMNSNSNDQTRIEADPFAVAERVLREAGVGFTVVEEPSLPAVEPPLAA